MILKYYKNNILIKMCNYLRCNINYEY